MDKKQIYAIIAACIIVGIFTFVAGFAAGNLASTSASLLLTMCKELFSPIGLIAIACYILAASLDVCSGMIKAFYLGCFKSSEMRKGLWKKAATVGIIAATSILAVIMYVLGIKISVWLIVAVSGWFGLMEISSILENAGQMGIKVPNFLKRSLDLAEKECEAKVPVEEKPAEPTTTAEVTDKT